MIIGEVRTVYAVLPDGSQIVRYDRAKRWYLETAGGARIRRFRRVSDAAQWAFVNGGTVWTLRPQGRYFDKYYLGMVNGTPVPRMRRYTEAGLRQAIKREQVKYARALARWQPLLNERERMFQHYEKYYGTAKAHEYIKLYTRPLPPMPQMDPYLRRKAG